LTGASTGKCHDKLVIRPATLNLAARMLGALLTSWTIRAALVCYAIYLALTLTTSRPKLARATWTTGCGLFIVHVACAFHFYHHWSHQAAWLKTADETRLILGVAFGDGIYFSYLFLVLWVADVVWLWFVETLPTHGSLHLRSARSATGVPPPVSTGSGTPSWRLAVHGFLLFIAVNGAIIFEAGATRIVGIPVVLGLAGLAVWCAWKPSRPVRELPPRESIHEDAGIPFSTSAPG
jgi:hypothetical protein